MSVRSSDVPPLNDKAAFICNLAGGSKLLRESVEGVNVIRATTRRPAGTRGLRFSSLGCIGPLGFM